MLAFEFYGALHFGEIGEVALIMDNTVYDPSIRIPDPGFEMSNGIKKVIWKNGEPYGIHARLGKHIKFNSLHFQGKAKRIMSQYSF